MEKQPEFRLKQKHLVSGLAGMLCPIPIIGEILLSGLLYPVLKEIPIFEKNIATPIIAAIATSTLTRLQFYEIMYLPMLNYTSEHISSLEPYISPITKILS